MKLQKIRDIIKKEVESLAGAKLKNLDEDIFFKSSFIDSMNMLNLIVFLERKFNIKIDTFFIDREAVGSVNKLADMIKSKLDKKGK